MPDIWVGSLSDYNNDGTLHGKWIDATQGVDLVNEEIQGILDSSPTAKKTGEPAEEYGVFDYDDFAPNVGRELGEYPNLEEVCTLAEAIEEHGHIIAVWASETIGFGSIDSLVSDFEDAQFGFYDDYRDFAEEAMWLGLEDVRESLPYLITGNIDYEGVLEDLRHDYTTIEWDGGVYAFINW